MPSHALIKGFHMVLISMLSSLSPLGLLFLNDPFILTLNNLIGILRPNKTVYNL